MCPDSGGCSTIPPRCRVDRWPSADAPIEHYPLSGYQRFVGLLGEAVERSQTDGSILTWSTILTTAFDEVNSGCGDLCIIVVNCRATGAPHPGGNCSHVALLLIPVGGTGEIARAQIDLLRMRHAISGEANAGRNSRTYEPPAGAPIMRPGGYRPPVAHDRVGRKPARARLEIFGAAVTRVTAIGKQLNSTSIRRAAAVTSNDLVP